MILLELLYEFLIQHKISTSQHFFIAYSGGLDSQVLLNLFYQLKKTQRLDATVSVSAIHVHHGLHQNANQWQQHCQQVCEQYQIPLLSEKIVIEKKVGESVEAIARDKRYAALAQHVTANSVLFTAHHRNDQAETFLLQALRGAGTKGLAAMPMIKKFAAGMQARPLLKISKESLLRYAIGQQLVWIEDDSNHENNFDRNFLRNEIFPILTKRYPAAAASIANSASHIAETIELLADFAAELYQQSQGNVTNSLSVHKLKFLTTAQQKLVLRHWLQILNIPALPSKKLESCLSSMLHAAKDRNPIIAWQQNEIRRYRDNIIVMPAQMPSVSADNLQWDLQSELKLTHGKLIPARQIGQGLTAQLTEVEICFRKGGEHLSLSKVNKTLKKLFHEWNVPPWLRNTIPLIMHQQKIIYIPGYFIAKDFQVKNHQEGIEIEFIWN